MAFEIEKYIAAGYPAIIVQGAEDQKILEDIKEAVKKINKSRTDVQYSFKYWTVISDWQTDTNNRAIGSGAKSLNDIIETVKAMLAFPKPGVYVLLNFHFFMKAPEIIQSLKDLIYKYKSENRHIIFVENVLTLPPELEKDVIVLDYELPSRDELNSVLDEINKDALGEDRVKVTKALRGKILDAASGMTYMEAENALALSYIETRKFDVSIINREKGQILRKSGLLEYYPAAETMDNVGGLANLKDWLAKRSKAFTAEAKEFGIEIPKGVILVGVPGAGKCVDGDSILWYNGGMKRIKTLFNDASTQLAVDLNIVSFDTQTNRFVSKKVITAIRNETKTGYCVNLNWGYQIKTSPWHPLWCEVNGVLDWYNVQDIPLDADVWFPIKVGHTWETEYVTVNIKYEIHKPNSAGRGKPITKISKYEKNIIINENVAYLLGVLYGDGCLSQLGKAGHEFYKSMGFTTADKEILVEVTKILSTEFDDSYITANRGSKYGYYINSAALAELIRTFNGTCRAENKGIPEIIFESPKSVVVAFLQGLFDTDGYSNKTRGYIQYCSASEELARDVHNLLLSLGIVCRIHFKDNRCLGAWYIDISGTYAKTFYYTVGFRLRRKQFNVNKLSNKFNPNMQFYPPGIKKELKRLFLTRTNRGSSVQHYARLSDSTKLFKAVSYWGRYYMNTDSARSITPDKMKIFEQDMCVGDDSRFQKYYGYGDIVWFKLTNITPCEVDLYDLSVPETNSFVANGFVNHNSLCSKAIANVWNMPLIRIDIGKAFGQYVGTSEANIRAMTKQLDAMAPAVAWLDEIEKSFAGASSSGNTDSGVTMRVLGTFLTWKQESTKPIFIVATCNNARQLPPELLRKGRFDEIFYLDIPNAEERKEIFKIHITKRKRDVTKFDLDKLVEASEGYVGSEIEESIKASLFDAFDAGREITTEDIIFTLQHTVPLTITMAEQINYNREWAKDKAKSASIRDNANISESVVTKKTITGKRKMNVDLN